MQKKIVFKNWQSNIGKYYSTSKLLIFPSLYEGLPNTLIDALNYSLPSISSKCSGAEDILSKKYTFFINSNDAKKLSMKMAYSIINYDKILTSTKKQHQKLNRFLVSNQVTKYLNFLTYVFNK